RGQPKGFKPTRLSGEEGGRSLAGSEVYDRLVVPFSNQREHGVLRISTVDYPAPAGDFYWTLSNAATGGRHPFNRRIDIIHVEVVNPRGNRNRLWLSNDPADRFAVNREHLVGPHSSFRGCRSLPAKRHGVERKRLFAIGSQQLMPTYSSGSARFSLPLVARYRRD